MYIAGYRRRMERIWFPREQHPDIAIQRIISEEFAKLAFGFRRRQLELQICRRHVSIFSQSPVKAAACRASLHRPGACRFVAALRAASSS